jgi:hypothetical protein
MASETIEWAVYCDGRRVHLAPTEAQAKNFVERMEIGQLHVPHARGPVYSYQAVRIIPLNK